MLLQKLEKSRRRLRMERLEQRRLLAVDALNLDPPGTLDVNADGQVDSRDVQFLGERMNRLGSEALQGSLETEKWDLNRDGSFSPKDALLLVNHLSTTSSSEATPIEDLGAESDSPLASSTLTPSSWITHHLLTESSLNSLINQYAANGFRPVRISGYEVGGQERFAAIWHPTDGVTWSASVGLTSAEYQQEFNSRASAGYRPTDVNGYSIGGVDHYAAVFEQTSGPNWFANHRLTSSGLQQVFDANVPNGYRLINVSGYNNSGADNYATLFEVSDGTAFGARSGMTAASFQTQLNNFASAGYDLVDVSGYVVNGVDYYTAIWELIGDLETVSEYGMTASEYQTEFNTRVNQGYTLIDVDGYTINGVDYYAASWGMSTPAFTEVPVTGESISFLDPVDAAVEQYMVERQITAGSVAISKDGQLLYEKAFGWSDSQRQTQLPTGSMFRLASVTKPITAATTRDLIANGLLSLDDQVFCTTESPNDCLLDVQPFTTPDSRLDDITVEHLLGHTAGWDRDVSGDPLFQQQSIANAMSIPSPPSKHAIASYVTGRPLDFSPGSRYAYSNFGYLVLGLVIEEVTGQAYTTYMQDNLFNPIGVADSEIELGRSLPGNRNPREPWYSDPAEGTNLFNTSETVPFPDGAFHIESMDSLGGQIATAPAIARFLDEYWISGHRRGSGNQNWTFFGSLPGTSTMARQRPDGLNVVVLFNNRRTPNGSFFDLGQMRQTFDQVLDGIAWPVPAVASVSVNQGSSDRSQLTSVDIDFDADINVSRIQDAFTLTNLTTDTQVTSLLMETTETAGGTRVSLRFGDGPSVHARQGEGPLGNSLADGFYRLDIDSGFVAGAYFGRTMNSDYSYGDLAGTDDFFRLFGDTDHDRDVDGQDYGRFGLSFLKSVGMPGYDARFDSDGDGDVDGQDYGRFGVRFLKSI